MSCVTNCTKCGALYEESSEERANEPDRTCIACNRRGKPTVADDLPDYRRMTSIRQIGEPS